MEYKGVCNNPWCKGTFIYNDNDVLDDIHPTECKKCKSFSNELSSGVYWEDRRYNDPSDDPHTIYRVKI